MLRSPLWGSNEGEQRLLIPERIDGALFEHTLPMAQPKDAFGCRLHDAAYILVRQPRCRHEGGRPVGVAHVDAVEAQDMEVNIEIHRAPKALHEGH